MKMNSTLILSVTVAALYLGLAGSVQAVPVPPTATVPDGGATGWLLGPVLAGLGHLRWQLKP